MLLLAVPQQAPPAGVNLITWHHIKEDKYYAMIEEYFGVGVRPLEQCMNAAMLTGYLDKAGASGEFDAKPGVSTTANDITFDGHPYGLTSGHIDWHAKLFRDLLAAPHSATVFCFSKAKRIDGENKGQDDVVFRTRLANGDVYYADLSHI